MVDVERRKSARRKIELKATVYEKDRKIPVPIIGISSGGVGLLSPKEINPGSKIKIVFSHTDKYAIGGTVQWAMLIYTDGSDDLDGKFQYRMGVKANEVLDTEDILNDSSL